MDFPITPMQERDRLSEEFQRGVGLTVQEASEEGASLRDQALRSAKSTRNVLAKVGEVATAAQQSATAMQGAAQAAAGLTRAKNCSMWASVSAMSQGLTGTSPRSATRARW